MIDHMINWLGKAEVKSIVLALNHMADRMQIELGNERNGTHIDYSIEEQPLGTGGPIRLAQSHFANDDFLVLNGDIVCDIRIDKMMRRHQTSGAEATIALVRVPDPTPYGLVNMDKTGIIRDFEEKRSSASPGLVNAGVYILSPEVIQRIPKTGMVSLERQVFPELAAKGVMMGWEHDQGYWYDVGKIPDYVEANRKLLEHSWIGKNVDPRKDPHHFGRMARIEEGAEIGPYTIISDGVTVKRGAVVKESIIFEDTVIEEKCRVDGCVIGEKVILGNGVSLGRGTLVAGQINIPAGTSYAPKSSVLNA